jgi:hypothetical protein
MTAEPAPATDRVPWRRSALAVGAAATAAWLGLLLLTAVHGADGARSFAGAVFALTGLVLSFITTNLLRRMWAGWGYGGGPALGRRLALAFEVLVALAIVLNVMTSAQSIQVMLAWTAVVCFLAAYVLAIPAPVRADDED